MIMVSALLIIFLVVKNPSILGTLSFPLIGFVEAIALAGLTSLSISLLGTRIAEKCNPPIELRIVWEFMVLAFIVDPTGEELLFRGLVEGYLLFSDVDLAVSVIVPAVLFSLMHILPYKDSPRQCLLLVLASAFIIGLVAGFLRASTGSITLPIIIHSIGNMHGLRYYLSRK